MLEFAANSVAYDLLTTLDRAMKLHEFPGSAYRAFQLGRHSAASLHNSDVPEVPVIISFTSIPSRLHVVHLTVRSILVGTVRPEKIVLWLNDQLESQLPTSLRDLLGPRFEIRYVSGTSSHRKLVHSLEAFPDKLLVTCDDDMMYAPHWLEYLYQDHLLHPDDIIANECRAIAYSEQGNLLPYRYWYREAKRGLSFDALLPIGFGGVLYPPGSLYRDVGDAALYLTLTPKADDLWFKAMSFLQGTRSRRASRPIDSPVAIANSQRVALRSTNVKQDGNRAQWQAVADHYALAAFLPIAIRQAPLQAPIAPLQTTAAAEPIDAVITWVDGSDPKHAAKLNEYLTQIGQHPKAALSTRFNDAGELRYCVASLLQFAPWLRTIHIVTDAQTPALINWIKNTPFANKIKLVDHKDIFVGNEQHLPTFNTRAISSLLWRISGLAEQFLYLNDDFALLRPVTPQDFFRDGRVVLRGSWRQMLWDRFVTAIGVGKSASATEAKDLRAKYLISQKLSARLAGFSYRYFEVQHDPRPMRISTLSKFFEQNPDFLQKNIAHRLRSREQFTVESLSAHIELANGNAVIDNRLNTLQIKPASQSRWRIKRKLKAADRKHTTAFVCVQSMDRASSRVQDMVFSWLLKRIGTLELYSHTK